MRSLFERGYWTPGRVAGVPVRLHWSLLVLAVFVGGLHLSAWLALFVVIFGHELGHLAVIRTVGGRAEEIAVTGLGGHCQWWGTVGAFERSAIAWGGVGAQLILLGTWLAARLAFGLDGPAWDAAHEVFVIVNLWIAALNLLPVPGLDGAEAWLIIPLAMRRLRAARRRSSPPRPSPPPWPSEPDAEERARREETDRVFNKMLNELLPPTVDQGEDDE